MEDDLTAAHTPPARGGGRGCARHWLAAFVCWAAIQLGGQITLGAEARITFFCGSDLHYGAVTPTNSSAGICRKVLHNMNHLPGQPYPDLVGGGVVAPPRGVLLLGDLTDSGRLSQWMAFTNDWGMIGDQLLKFPVFEGFGNHDTPTSFVFEGLKARNRIRPGLTDLSTNSYHYSLDWDFLHVVCLNVFPGNEVTTNGATVDPQQSLAFLADDLSRHVGRSGRPVIVCHHYGLDETGSGWWTDQQRDNYYEVLRNYNVIGVLAGHNHFVGICRWHGLDAFTDGTIGKYAGNFLVCFVTRTNIAVLDRTLTDEWGKFIYSHPIVTPPDEK